MTQPNGNHQEPQFSRWTFRAKNNANLQDTTLAGPARRSIPQSITDASPTESLSFMASRRTKLGAPPREFWRRARLDSLNIIGGGDHIRNQN